MITRSGATMMRRTPPLQEPEREEDVEVLPEPRNLASASTVEIKESMASEIGRAIAQALQAQTRNRVDTPRVACPTFSGQEHESPVDFFVKLREYTDYLEIQDEDEILNLGVKQLKGEASRWYAPFSDYVRTLIEFETRIKNKYDDSSTRARLQAKLYSERQRENECVSLFILRKRALFNRLAPRTDESYIIPVVIELIHTPIRAYLRTKEFFLLDELDAAASRVEEDLKSMTPPPRRMPPPVFYPSRPPANNQIPPTPRTNDRTNIPDRAGPSTSAPRQTNTNFITNTGIPPSPCRYCKEWHFHSRCPKNPYRQPPENSPRAGGSEQN